MDFSRFGEPDFRKSKVQPEEPKGGRIGRTVHHGTVVYHLVETCEHGDLRDDMQRDRLVVGIRDSAMSQKLQMDPELTLEKAMKSVRQSAAVKEQQGQLKQLKRATRETPNTIEEVRTGRPQTGGGASRRDKSVRYRKGGTRETQPRIQGGAKLGKRKPQDPQPKQLLATNGTQRATSAPSVSLRL